MGRGDVFGVALAAEFSPAEIVGVENDDVRLRRVRRQERGEQREDEGEAEEKAGFHSVRGGG